MSLLKTLLLQNKLGVVVDGKWGPKSREAWESQGSPEIEVPVKVGDREYEVVAKWLGVETRALKAVTVVESGGRSGFIAPNKPAILFEGHVFWRELSKRGIDPQTVLKNNPSCKDILYPTWTKAFYKGGVEEYRRLEKATTINNSAALSSMSMGLFQVMGNNFKACGEPDVETMWKNACSSEGNQLAQAAAFIKGLGAGKAVEAMKKKDWATFARLYNGPAYAKNAYDKKLAAAYSKLK